MRIRYILLVLAPLLPACQQEMAVQPSIRPDQPDAVEPDGRASRPGVSGTVARGHLRTDLALFAGKRSRPTETWRLAATLVGNYSAYPILPIVLLTTENGNNVDSFPFPVTRAVLEHGRDRFMIYCVVCHDPLGTGNGMIVQRGYTQPPSYHIDRLRQVAVGHFFDVMTNGYGSMPDYREQVPVRDRWAIAAYIRALQLSQHFPDARLTDAMRSEWARQDSSGENP